MKAFADVPVPKLKIGDKVTRIAYTDSKTGINHPALTGLRVITPGCLNVLADDGSGAPFSWPCWYPAHLIIQESPPADEVPKSPFKIGDRVIRVAYTGELGVSWPAITGLWVVDIFRRRGCDLIRAGSPTTSFEDYPVHFILDPDENFVTARAFVASHCPSQVNLVVQRYGPKRTDDQELFNVHLFREHAESLFADLVAILRPPDMKLKLDGSRVLLDPTVSISRRPKDKS